MIQDLINATSASRTTPKGLSNFSPTYQVFMLNILNVQQLLKKNPNSWVSLLLYLNTRTWFKKQRFLLASCEIQTSLYSSSARFNILRSAYTCYAYIFLSLISIWTVFLHSHWKNHHLKKKILISCLLFLTSSFHSSPSTSYRFPSFF